MKVCIVTWFNSQNYGTCLQGFALYYFLKKHCCDAILLNTKIYINYKDVKYVPIIMSRIKRRIKIYLKDGKGLIEKRKIRRANQSAFQKRDDLFAEFKKMNMKVTLPLSDEKLNELSESMDVFVTGSDQIWNPHFLSTRYLLDFVDDSTMKVAYSSSFGVTKLPNKKTEKQYKKFLSRFAAISVREQAGIDICNKLGLSNVKRVVDPTMLLSKDEWMKILSVNDVEVSDLNEDYILCYFVGNSTEYWNYISEVSKRTSLHIKVIPFSNTAYNSGYDLCIETGPLEFVKLIMNAKYVYTDSFHCTCFSIIYNRQFTVLERFSKHDKRSQNNRLTDLFALLRMDSRIVDFQTIVTPEEADIVNYQEVNDRIDKLRNDSEQYLLGNLNIAL